MCGMGLWSLHNCSMFSENVKIEILTSRTAVLLLTSSPKALSLSIPTRKVNYFRLHHSLEIKSTSTPTSNLWLNEGNERLLEVRENEA